MIQTHRIFLAFTLDIFCITFSVNCKLKSYRNFFIFQLTKAYFGFVEVLCGSYITFILQLDTATFMHLVGSLESGLKGLDTSISSQVRNVWKKMLRPVYHVAQCLFLSTDIYISSFQCAIAVDNLATYYFNNITMGEAPNSPAAIRFAQHIADCPSLFPEVTPLISL